MDERDTRTPEQRLAESIDRRSGVVRLDLLEAHLTAAADACTEYVMRKGVPERDADYARGKAAACNALLSLLTKTPETP